MTSIERITLSGSVEEIIELAHKIKIVAEQSFEMSPVVKNFVSPVRSTINFIDHPLDSFIEAFGVKVIPPKTEEDLDSPEFRNMIRQMVDANLLPGSVETNLLRVIKINFGKRDVVFKDVCLLIDAYHNNDVEYSNMIEYFDQYGQSGEDYLDFFLALRRNMYYELGKENMSHL